MAGFFATTKPRTFGVSTQLNASLRKAFLLGIFSYLFFMVKDERQVFYLAFYLIQDTVHMNEKPICYTYVWNIETVLSKEETFKTPLCKSFLY